MNNVELLVDEVRNILSAEQVANFLMLLDKVFEFITMIFIKSNIYKV